MKTSTTQIAFEIVRDTAAVAPVWQTLESELASTGLTNSWAWTECWLDAYGATVPHWFVIATRDGHPVGAALLTRGRKQRRGPLPIRTIHLGTSGEEPGRGVWVEYNRVLVHPKYRDAFFAELLSVPGALPLSADVLALDGFELEDIPQSARGKMQIREKVCRVARLNDAPTLLESFDGDTRRKLRKNSKKFTDAFGDLAVEWIDSVPRALIVFDEMVEHHQRRWTAAGEAGAFADTRFTSFHRLLIERTLGSGQVVMARTTAGETLVGIFYGFIENDVIYQYQWGLPAFEDNSLSPGFVAGFLVMEEARRRNFSEVNWLAGDSRFKRDMSNGDRTLIWAEKTLSPWNSAINGLISLYGRLPEAGKQKIRGTQ